MLIKATLSNARHPEYGEVTIPLPIKTSEYDHTMEMLANLEIGNVMGRDCKIMELSSPYSILWSVLSRRREASAGRRGDCLCSGTAGTRGGKAVCSPTRQPDHAPHLRISASGAAHQPLLGSGEINHSGSGENRQFWSNENHQSGVASPQVVLFTRPAAGQPVSQ